MTSIQSAWKAVADAVKPLNVYNLPTLNPPASEEEIASLEKFVGQELPEELLQSLQIHNGEASDTFGFTNTISCQEIEREIAIQMGLLNDYPGHFDRYENDPAIKQVFWSPQWIPFAADGGGNLWCLDLDPTPEGTKGQVIFWDHEGSCTVEQVSIAEYLQNLVDQIGDAEIESDQVALWIMV